MILPLLASAMQPVDWPKPPEPPARCSTAKRIAFHAFNAIDKTATVIATRNGGDEANPVLRSITGKKVSVLEGVAAFAITSGLHELVLSGSCKGQTVAVGVQGAAAVYMTVRFLF